MPTINLGPCDCCGGVGVPATCYYDGDESFQCVADGDDPPEGWTAVAKGCPGQCCCYWLQPFDCGGTSENAPCDVAPPSSFAVQFRVANTFTTAGFGDCGDNAAAYMNQTPELPVVTFTLSSVTTTQATYNGTASGNGWTLLDPLPVATLTVCQGQVTISSLYWERQGGLVKLDLWGQLFPSARTIYLTPTNVVYPDTVCDAAPAYAQTNIGGGAVLDASLVTPCDDGLGPNDPTYPANPAPRYDAPTLTFSTFPPQEPPVCYSDVPVDCGVCCEADGSCTAGIDGGSQNRTACEDAGGTWVWGGDCSDCAFLGNPLP